jgi:4-diphosphocytidyl-2-C-methyl-D-erythritol kinase
MIDVYTPHDIILYPPAKINLFLQIGPKREDEYHDISSILQTIDLRDRMVIKILEQQKLELKVTGAGVPDSAENTVSQAYEAFRKICPDVAGINLQLVKRIPVGAGLGGGSSDAAALLRFLKSRFAPEITDEQLVEAAASVGSDVPFFLYGGTCRVEGRGEKVTVLPTLPSVPILIFHPNVSISTLEAYKAFDQLPDKPRASIEPALKAVKESDWEEVANNLFNSFEKPVFQGYLPLADLYGFCLKQGFRQTLLAGSGSNLFVISPYIQKLNDLQQETLKYFPDVMSTITQTSTE